MITGSEYLLRGQTVRVVTAWNGKSNPDLARLQALLPLVSTRPNAPRNVEIELPDGTRQVRPFRGLRKPPAPRTAWEQPVLGECGDGYGAQTTAGRAVETVAVAGGVL